jgi:fructose-bisphosphate aldolase class I
MQYQSELLDTVQKLCTKGKGILAADESTGTIGKRFKTIDVKNNLENRRGYRELLFSTPGLEDTISGVITYEETLLDKSLTKHLFDKDIVVGIKTDRGLQDLNDEKFTKGLDTLREMSQKYYQAGARFAKWRCVYNITDTTPSLAIEKNADTLAHYALISQECGLVPIIEPEILMEGVHDYKKCSEVVRKVLTALYKKMDEYKVFLSGSILKTGFVTCGSEYPTSVSLDDVAMETVDVFQSTVPKDVPGIFFLSGGLSETVATTLLSLVSKIQSKNSKVNGWYLSFSYGRALQASTLKAWQGKADNIALAQKALLERGKANSDATLGK